MLRISNHFKRGIQQFSRVRNFSNKFEELKDSRTKGPVTFISLGLAFIVGCGVVGLYTIEKEKKTKALARAVKSVGKPALGGPWVLVDQDGMPRTDATYRGYFTLLYFGFTYCPDICPSELVKVGKIVNALEKKKVKEMIPILISVDPKRDTVGQMKHYAQDFHPSIQYLTGTREQIAAAAKAYRVYFSKANENENDEDDYLVDHSIVLYLVNPDGEFVDFFTQRMEVPEIVDKIDKYVKEYHTEKAAEKAAEK